MHWIGLSLMGLFALAPGVRAGDWPQLLGPQRDGVVEAEAGRKLVEPTPLWDRELGAGFAGPVVAEGKLVVAHRLGDELVVEAVDAQTGVMLWRFSRPTDYVDGFGFDNGPRGVPAIAAGRVFVHGADGVVDALELATGKALWQVDTVAEFASPQGFFGRACSPLVMGDRLILTPGGRRAGEAAGVVALAVDSGKLLWQAVDDEAGYASPVALDEKRMLCWLRNELWLVAVADGAVLARRALRSGMDASVNACQPVFLPGEKVLISAGYGVGLHLLSLPDLKPLWEQENLLDCHYGTPVVMGQYVFGFDGRAERGQTLRCIDIETREKRWQSDTVPGGTLIRVGTHLLAVTEQGEVWVVEANEKALQVVHREQILRSGHRAHLAYSDGILFARDGAQLVAVRVME